MSSDGDAPGSTDAISELARAKVNLTLRVLGRRADGYHALESLVAFADVGDLVTLTPGAAPCVKVRGPFAGSIAGENLVARALERLSAAQPALRLGSVVLDKRIPVSAGLGGGSADAAALLRAVRRANPAFETQFDWHGFGVGLGADVPVCVASTPAQMWGIGDELRPVRDFPRLDAVLVTPAVSVPSDKTRQVFGRLAARPVASPAVPEPLPRFGSADEAIEYVAAHRNDLTETARALMPGAGDAEHALASSDGCRAHALACPSRVVGVCGDTGLTLRSSRDRA